MYNKTFIITALLACTVCFAAQAKNPVFRFNADGKFKIIQVTDTHINWDSPHSQETVDMLNQVLDAEKPDIVIFTGDVVTSKPYQKGLERVIEPIVSRKIPWALVYGNHDDEQDWKRDQLGSLISQYPYFAGDMKKVKNVTGYGNYVIEVKGHNANKPTALLYCMDSRAYSTLKPYVDGYGWFAFDQVDWYRRTSDKYTAANGGSPLPALAFFHIPLPEYRNFDTHQAPKEGTKLENECSPEVNSGMFLSMLEKRDVMGVFVGHDHINDYIFNYCGIALAYGRFSGSKTTYTQMKNGVRVIELTENEPGFRTWIRLNDEIVIQEVNFPQDLPYRIEKDKQ
ncbi:MAG: metallophosphoesterase family protein [Tannerella sp.]|jgi:predicted phosphodiesterase|nr:metallophosphoesterase family protein [Tannerella sp.]